MTKNTETPVEHSGGTASTAGKAVQEASDEVRAQELGVTGTRETTLAGLAGEAPVVDREKAAADEAKRQKADDERRKAFYAAEKKAAEAAEKARAEATKGITTHEGI